MPFRLPIPLRIQVIIIKVLMMLRIPQGTILLRKQHSPANPPSSHEPDGKRFFSLACCSAHLTGVMPLTEVFASRVLDDVETNSASGHPVQTFRPIDPPPRGFV